MTTIPIDTALPSDDHPGWDRLLDDVLQLQPLNSPLIAEQERAAKGFVDLLLMIQLALPDGQAGHDARYAERFARCQHYLTHAVAESPRPSLP